MYDEEIEKAVLYYVIFQEEWFDLNEEDFVNATNQKIIKAVNTLKAKKIEISMLTINSELQDDSILQYLAYLGDYTSRTTADTAYKILKDYTKQRQAFNLAKQVQLEVRNAENVDAYIEQTISKLQKIQLQTQEEESFMQQVVTAAEVIEKNTLKQEDYSLYTGFFDLDALTDGLHNGELTVVGARPGVGKTTFALQIAENIAKKGKSIAYVSLEMSETQMIQKMLSMRTHVNSRKIRNGDLDEQELERIGLDCVSLAELKINLITKASTIQQIETTTRKLKNKDNLDLLVIDYLQLVRNAGIYKNREQEVADISRTLKLLSLELDIPIIALCQLNRNASRMEPTLADIRESGAIEQDADNVIFLYQENQENNIVKVDLQKQRAGNIGSIELKFNKVNSEFVNLVR